jgi:hypothetical protein
MDSLDGDIFDPEAYSDEEVDQILRDNGYDPKEVAEWGLQKIREILEEQGSDQ